MPYDRICMRCDGIKAPMETAEKCQQLQELVMSYDRVMMMIKKCDFFPQDFGWAGDFKSTHHRQIKSNVKCL